MGRVVARVIEMRLESFRGSEEPIMCLALEVGSLTGHEFGSGRKAVGRRALVLLERL
jgi:hypothetical protein